MYGVLIAMIYGIKVLDNYLKKQSAIKGDPNIVDYNQVTQIKNETGHVTAIQIDNSFIMVPLLVVLSVIMIWCFYLKFVLTIMKKSKI